MASLCFGASSCRLSSISSSLSLSFLLLASKDIFSDPVYCQRLSGNSWDGITLKTVLGSCFTIFANLESNFFSFLGKTRMKTSVITWIQNWEGIDHWHITMPICYCHLKTCQCILKRYLFNLGAANGQWDWKHQGIGFPDLAIKIQNHKQSLNFW